MLSQFICGSFQKKEGDQMSSPCTRKPRKKDSNPYANRGLDKFSALLAELEEKRHKIYSQVGPQNISLVRFVYSSSNDCIPVIVKVKNPQSQFDHNQQKDHDCKISKTTEKVEVANQEKRLELDESNTNEEKNEKKVYLELHKRRPKYHVPVVVVLILVVLAVSGRFEAVLCASVGWFLVPILSSKKYEKQANFGSGLKMESEERTENSI